MPDERDYASKGLTPSELAGFTPEQIEDMVEKVKERLVTAHGIITDSPRWPNIKLEGKRIILTDAPNGERFDTNGVEFFLDEHGYQWVKFTPANGPHRGHEHCIRTEKVYAVIDNRKA